jgi:hypothetical protein
MLEIDARLQEIVPKLNEVNMICREVGREHILYDPDIMTEFNADGTRQSKVAVRVYPDRKYKHISSTIPLDVFIDETYFKIKELYDEVESAGFELDQINMENDDETFGWSLTEEWYLIGNVYFFLLSIYNLLDVSDESSIYDAKGMVVGRLTYDMKHAIYDTDKTTKLSVIDKETLDELHGKYLKM